MRYLFENSLTSYSGLLADVIAIRTENKHLPPFASGLKPPKVFLGLSRSLSKCKKKPSLRWLLLKTLRFSLDEFLADYIVKMIILKNQKFCP